MVRQILFDAERSGLLLLEATLDESLHTATIVMGNTAYPIWIDAVDHMVIWLTFIFPLHRDD